jgi:hypothetical protein
MSKSWLTTAIQHIHRDPFWWRSVLIGGACMTTIFGWPLAGGLVVEHMENGSKGYPTPLPPWVDKGTRYIIGIFALIIDFVLFLLPLFIAGSLLICAIVGTLFAYGGSDASGNAFQTVASLIIGIVALYELALFLLGASPLARMKYIEEGRIEQAIGNDAMRAALKSEGRPFYLKARLVSLPAYLPMLILVGIFWGITFLSFSGQLFVLLILAWLILSALLYAHLVVGQVYVLAEQEYQNWEYEQRVARR